MTRPKKQPEHDAVLNDYVTTEQLSISSGLSEGALYKYIERKQVTLDVEYFRGGNKRIMWDVRKFNEWLRGRPRSKSIRVPTTSESKPNSLMRV